MHERNVKEISRCDRKRVGTVERGEIHREHTISSESKRRWDSEHECRVEQVNQVQGYLLLIVLITLYVVRVYLTFKGL